MALTPQSELRDVHGISDDKKVAIKTFMQGAVYCWVKNRKGEQFAVRDLMGGENFEWEGTPLYALYEKHIGKGKSVEDAVAAAAIDLGWLVKATLVADKRNFEAVKDFVNIYRWVGNEP